MAACGPNSNHLLRLLSELGRGLTSLHHLARPVTTPGAVAASPPPRRGTMPGLAAASPDAANCPGLRELAPAQGDNPQAYPQQPGGPAQAGDSTPTHPIEGKVPADWTHREEEPQ